MVDPGQVAVMALADSSTAGTPALSQRAVVLLAAWLALAGFERYRRI